MNRDVIMSQSPLEKCIADRHCEKSLEPLTERKMFREKSKKTPLFFHLETSRRIAEREHMKKSHSSGDIYVLPKIQSTIKSHPKFLFSGADIDKMKVKMSK
jgi:hypothetical protein